MMRARRGFLLMGAAAMALGGARGQAETGAFGFDSIDGGRIELSAFRGRPVLVVNTASQCGFTPQYDGLQALHRIYGPQGVLVLAVPSDSFNQELASEEEVATFCEVNYNLTLPMTTITPVRGQRAHPFYRWLAQSHGVSPRWNFTKVLLDGQGAYVAHFGSRTRPTAPVLTAQIEALLAQ